MGKVESSAPGTADVVASGVPRNAMLAQALFAPRGIALIGAPSDSTKPAARPLRFLRQHGYAGSITVINPRLEGQSIDGTPCVARMAHCEHSVDHALLMVAPERIPDALAECAAQGVTLATVFTGGYADAGSAGALAQAALVAQARTAGIRLLGPNSIGVMNCVPGGAMLSANAVLAMPNIAHGSTAVVSQSGSMLGALLSRGLARGLAYSRLVSVGNEADVSTGEVLDLLVDDPATRTILLFLETLRDAPALARAAARAHTAGKAVIAYKLGRSATAQALARTHTGALSGEEAAVDAFFAHCGIARVASLEALVEAPPLFAHKPPALEPPAMGGRAPRVACVSTTGGGAAMVAENLALRGVELVAPPVALREQLAGQGIVVGESAVIDLTLTATPGAYRTLLNALRASEHCDAVLAVVGSSAQFDPALAVQPILQSMAENAHGKGVFTFFAPDAPASLKRMAEAGIAAFRTPEACADAVAAWFAQTAPQPLPQAVPLKVRVPRGEAEALDLVAQLGIPTVQRAVVTDDAQCPLSFPVAVKVLAAELAHKSDIGGVVLNVRDATGYRDACAQVRASMHAHLPQFQLNGRFQPLLVQAMVSGVAELIVGFKRDPLVGPTVLVGLGGLWAEMLDDTISALAPVTDAQAHAMLLRLRGARMLTGARGQPAADLEAASIAIAKFSNLAGAMNIAEAEINPLVVRAKIEDAGRDRSAARSSAMPETPDGAIAVDALFVGESTHDD